MDFGIQNLPDDVNAWDVTRAFAKILHSHDFYPRKPDERLINFEVKLNPSRLGGIRNNGTGTLTMPSESVGRMLLDYLRANPLRIKNKKIKLYVARSRPRQHVAQRLQKTPYVSPDVEEEHQKKVQELEDKLHVDKVQFGVFYRERYPNPLEPREFSIEWENNSAAWLRFLGASMPSASELTTVDIAFSNIRKIGVGYDFGIPYLCFDTVTPPILEAHPIYRTLTGDADVDNKHYVRRLGYLNLSHAEVAPYAPHVRVVLYPNADVIKKFISMCNTSGLDNSTIIKCPDAKPIVASRQRFFRNLHNLHNQLAELPWAVAFQMESLLHNGLLITPHLWKIMPDVKKMCNEQSEDYVGAFLRSYHEALQVRPEHESPMKCFTRIQEKFIYLQFHDFRCCHVTFTPTRMLLKGPYATDSNRIIRDFQGYEEHFIRVEFREEARVQYQWDKKVDGASFIQERVGKILKEGFELAGRRFEFLAYSTSALREHSVWFMNPFVHPTRGLITSEIIRNNIGDFTDLLKKPSKYAARIAQAFTATKPSVIIQKNEWEEMLDITPPIPKGKDAPDYLFTDGVGAIAKSLGDRIWKKLCENMYDKGERSIQPSAYQIRFLGYKGVVCVDEQLDKRLDGIIMRLRPSMKKFQSHADEAELEIAKAFAHPGPCYLNRPLLVMLLEDQGVRRDVFERLQDIAVADARSIDESVTQFRKILDTQGLGHPFRVSHILRHLENLGLTLPQFDNPFFKQLRQVAMTSILREIKYRARIPVPESYLLVGVADEGPSYAGPGCEDHAYRDLLIPSPSILKAPVVFHGALSVILVMRVRAIGKPPADKLCLFSHLKNVVVLPSIGARPLASCLSGGDLDGDLYAVINYDPLLPKEIHDPASYVSPGTLEISYDSTVDDICDFIVEYIHSDVLGLLSDKLITIADQSSEGMRDKACIQLAALCSQAVDYPKQGIPVNIDDTLPRPLMRCKPDWQAGEAVAPRRTDYYESTRALGYLYRAITLEDPGPPVKTDATENDVEPITLALLDQITLYLGEDAHTRKTTSDLFQKYSDELSYIRATHALSDTRLLETEVVVGTILAKSSSHKLRSDRMYRMRLHGSSLVREVQRELIDELDVATPEKLLAGLQRAWGEWEFSQRNEDKPGANSFGLIALGVVLDCLDRLQKSWA